jgi:ABC-type amino acid transport substrate-binding protein
VFAIPLSLPAVFVTVPVTVAVTGCGGGGDGAAEVVGDRWDAAPYGIILAKNQGQFAQAVQGAVKSLMTDGTYKTILEKWYVSTGAIPTSEIRS